MLWKLKRAWREADWPERMLWLYIILIPLMHVRRVPLFERKLQYSEAAFIPFVILWCTRWLRAGERRLHFPLLYPILFLTAAFALSLLNSESAGASALEFGGFFYLAALYFMALNILKGPGSLDRALRIWVFVGAIVSLLGLAAFGLHLAGWSPEVARNPFLFYSPMEAEAQGFPRITSTFRNPNMLVTYLQVTLSFGLALFFGKATGEGGRGWLAFGLCLIVAAAILTGSRREVGLFLTLFLILCLYGSGWLGALLRYLSFVALVGLAALSVLTTFWVIFPLEVRWGQGGRSLEVKADFSYSLHRLQHETAIRMIRDHPLIGVGYGTFTKNFPRYIDRGGVERDYGFNVYPGQKRLLEEGKLAFDPHSTFLGAWAEAGLLGLAAIASFFAACLGRLGRAWRGLKGLPQERWAGCFLMGMVGLTLNAVFFDFLSVRHFWLFLAAAMALRAWSPRPGHAI